MTFTSVLVVTEERLSATIGDGLDSRKNFLMDECREIGGIHWRELGGIKEGAAGRGLGGHQLGRPAPALEPAELFLPLTAGSGSGDPLAGSALRAGGGDEWNTNQATAVGRQWCGVAQGGGRF